MNKQEINQSNQKTLTNVILMYIYAGFKIIYNKLFRISRQTIK